MNAVNAPEHVRDIDTGAPPTRYARGWHCLGLADPFRDGRPHAVEASSPETTRRFPSCPTRR